MAELFACGVSGLTLCALLMQQKQPRVGRGRSSRRLLRSRSLEWENQENERTQQSSRRLPAWEPEERCVVCLSAACTHACVPCGHRCSCNGCAPRLRETCPICRVDLQRMVAF
mmetsp:Transcript_138338/g.359482  ORF Transcript_138338/g.359482 Transcript_138338/m.359482 type:complete len:113 (+) Transcript_138338:53-391(+)